MGVRRPGSSRRFAQRDEQQAGEPLLDRIERDRFKLLGGVAQAAAKHFQGVAGDGGVIGERGEERLGGQRGDAGRLDRRHVGGARAAVEHRDFADHLAGRGDAHAEFATLGRHNRDAQPSLEDYIKPIAGVAAAAQQFPRAQRAFTQRGGDRGQRRVGNRCE